LLEGVAFFIKTLSLYVVQESTISTLLLPTLGKNTSLNQSWRCSLVSTCDLQAEVSEGLGGASNERYCHRLWGYIIKLIALTEKVVL
jgi:hypothetical protein